MKILNILLVCWIAIFIVGDYSLPRQTRQMRGTWNEEGHIYTKTWDEHILLPEFIPQARLCCFMILLGSIGLAYTNRKYWLPEFIEFWTEPLSPDPPKPMYPPLTRKQDIVGAILVFGGVFGFTGAFLAWVPLWHP